MSSCLRPVFVRLGIAFSERPLMMCCSCRTVLCRKLASTDCNASPHVNNIFFIINLRISTHLKVTPALSHRQEQVQLFFKALSIGMQLPYTLPPAIPVLSLGAVFKCLPILRQVQNPCARASECCLS